MTGPQFFQTGMGRKFFEVDVPALVKAMNRIADALEKQTVVQSSEDDNVFCIIKWSREDLNEAMRKASIEPSEDNIQRLLESNFSKILEQRSVEEGWTILDDLIWMVLKEK